MTSLEVSLAPPTPSVQMAPLRLFKEVELITLFIDLFIAYLLDWAVYFEIISVTLFFFSYETCYFFHNSFSRNELIQELIFF